MSLVAMTLVNHRTHDDAPILEEGDILKVAPSGFFHKLGSVLSHKNRPKTMTLTLKDNSLSYCKKASRGRKTQLNLVNARISTLKHGDGYMYVKVVSSKGVTLSFRGLDEESTQHWASLLAKVQKEVRVFGSPIERFVVSHPPHMNLVIHKCIEMLILRNGIQEEGLFRIPGSVESIGRLRQTLEKEREKANLTSELDVHSVAGLIKCYLRELPDPLFPDIIANELAKARDIPSNILRFAKYEEILRLLPPVNYATMRHITWFLHHIHRNSEKTRMDSKNLAMVLSPNIFPMPQDSDPTLFLTLRKYVPVFRDFIEYHELIFNQQATTNKSTHASTFSAAAQLKTQRRKASMKPYLGISFDPNPIAPPSMVSPPNMQGLESAPILTSQQKGTWRESRSLSQVVLEREDFNSANFLDKPE
eukprot:TRINITY_DN5389_c0_g1_i2.p1 TRINITY_DN5389_c0_g1~~TRINITY_DN5389_c0_g1_i2.p1  ORF type:complete len:419 (+),score=73.92 TRINITY_DN5389_c0_g1_i2:675-1931(+)